MYAHADLSQALTQAGIAVTLIAYGAHKTEGNEFEPLSKDARDHIQTDIDELGELFVATVARNRGIKPAQVRDTQAATFLGGAGVDIGLADAVLAPDEAFRSLLSQMDQQSTR